MINVGTIFNYTEYQQPMNKEIIQALFPDEYAKIESGICPSCNIAIADEEFDDDKPSFKEYLISGLCKDCQDKTFDKVDNT